MVALSSSIDIDQCGKTVRYGMYDALYKSPFGKYTTKKKQQCKIKRFLSGETNRGELLIDRMGIRTEPSVKH